MKKVGIFTLVLFCLDVSQIEAGKIGKKSLDETFGHGASIIFYSSLIGGLIGLLVLCFAIYYICDVCCKERNVDPPTAPGVSPLTRRRINQVKAERSSPSKIGSKEEHPPLGKKTILVTLVDEELNNLHVPSAEVNLTSFDKLLSDLVTYAGLPNTQGILVKAESGDFIQVFDMEKIPNTGSFKLKVVKFGERTFLQLHPNE